MEYLKYKISAALVLSASLFISSCSKEKFAEFNTNPDAVTAISPQPIFTKAITGWHDDSFEAFYENYRGVSRWTRQMVSLTGNTNTITDGIGNINQRYGRFYLSSGNLLVDVQKTIDKLPDDQKPRYAQMRVIAEILKVYEAWFVTDGNGSMPYTQALQARYNGTLTPVYDTQQQLYDNFEKTLKESVAALKAQPAVEQVSLGTNDLYYQGSVPKWIKAATSLRLLIAMRLSKKDPAKLKAIVTDILTNNAADLISSTDEDWSFKASSSLTGASGNYDVSASSAYGANGTIDFMWRNGDPRLPLFYQKNSWTTDNFAAAKTQGKIPATAVYDNRRYYGQFTSPDASTFPAKQAFLSPVVIKNGTNNVNLDTVSAIQTRMFYPNYNSGSGSSTFLILTYADVCFLRAELAARNITTESAADWYNKGITASITTYDNIAKNALLPDYVALDAGAIAAYKSMPEIAYNPAKGLEQILIQQYLNFYKNYNECWALLKRTGLPNAQTALSLEDFVVGGQIQTIPRRFVINFPLSGDANFANKQAAIAEMAKDPNFGQPTDVKGRVWWDIP
jgi:hypothetical protein